MANLREGKYGTYYGSFFTESEPLSQSEMELNADYIFKALTFNSLNNGWTVNAICALLGNMQAESTINPGRWQNDNGGNTSNGYGLVQWTPSTKYTEWCSDNGFSDPSEMDSNIARILYEVENGLQWIARDDYNLSFKEFTKSTESIDYLAKAFLLCYERPADQSESVQNYRAELGNSIFGYLYNLYNGSFPDEPTGTITHKEKRKYKFILFNARKKERNMDKVIFQNRISEIGTCEDEATRRELLSQLQEEVIGDYDRLTELETTNSKLTSDNESLRSANMKLFLRIGDHKAPDNDSLDDGQKEKREFKNLFNEKGGIK